MFGEVLFLDLDGDRNLHNNNSPNSPIFFYVQVLCVCGVHVHVCGRSLDVLYFVKQRKR